MTSQLLSAALDNRALLKVWPPWLDSIWIVLWSLVGVVIGMLTQRLRWWMSLSAGIAFSLLSAYLGLLNALWLPLIPVIIAFVISSQISQFWRDRPRNQNI